MAHRLRTASIATTAVALGLPLRLFELVRFRPVLSGLHTTQVDAANPVQCFEPNHQFTYSLGARLQVVVRGRATTRGWVNDQVCDSTATTRLLAVIGDSYVEALMVAYRESLQGRLAASTPRWTRCARRGRRSGRRPAAVHHR